MSTYSFKKRGDKQVGEVQSTTYLNSFLTAYSNYLNFNTMDRKAYYFDEKTVEEQMTLNGSTSPSIIIGSWEKNQKFHDISGYAPPVGGLPISFKKNKKWRYGVLFPSPYTPPSPNTFIRGIGAQIANAAALETKLGLAVGDVQVYSNDGTDIECYIDVNYMIPNNCFLNNTAITEYIDSDGKITQIGSSGFRGATNLTTVEMEGVLYILVQAFKSCTSLTGASFPNALTLGNNVFEGCSVLLTSNIESATTIGEYCYRNNTALQSCVTTSLVSMGKNAFENNNSLTSLDLPNLTSMGQSACFGCDVLDTVNVPLLPTIPTYAFASSPLLANVDITSAVTIGAYAFQGNTAMTSIAGPAVTTLGNSCFYQCKIKGVDFPLLLTIGNSSFEYCQDLLTFPTPNVTSIGNQGLFQCIAMTGTLDAPSLTFLGTNSLAGTNIDYLRANDLITLSAGALTGCTLLTQLAIEATQTIGDYAFSGVPVTLIYIPSLLSSTQDAFTGWAYTGQEIQAPLAIVGTDAGLLQAVVDGATVTGI